MSHQAMAKIAKLLTLSGCAAALAAAATPALAQDNPAVSNTSDLQPRAENGRQIYEATQFARFAPQTALDMVSQIPGFSITEVSGDRGLGEASQNVLINGQRVTGKSNDARTALSRIPVSSVVQFEIADAATFNISGIPGQVLNVITLGETLKGNFVWKPQMRSRIPFHWSNAEVNISGKLGKGDFTLGLNNTNNTWRGGGWGEEVVRDANGDLLFVRETFGVSEGDGPKLTGTYARKSEAGSIFNANAAVTLYRSRDFREFDVLTPGQPDSFELSRNGEDEWNMELGADYEFAIGSGRLKLIGYNRFEHSAPYGLFRREFTTAQPDEAFTVDRVIDEGESVARAEYRWKAGKADWQISAEGAYNFLDAKADYASLDANGVFQPFTVDGSTARVEEKRGQLILSYGRPLTSALSFQSAIGGEYSQLSQSGSADVTRTFIRPKGSATLSWKASPRLSATLKAERKVGQLNFFDFLASRDLQNNNSNAGNAQLVPPQSWLLNLEANRSLGPSGSIKLKLDAEKISDIVDQIAISPTEESIGNLPSAKRLRAEINASLLLDTIGFKGAKLDLTGAYQYVSLRDSLGIKRPISDRGRTYWNIDFRHDIPATPLAWGVFAEDSGNYGFYRLDYFVRNFTTGPMVGAFVEHKNVLGLKVRGQIFNLAGQTERYREVFYTDRRDGDVDFTHDGVNRYGLIYRMTVSGTF
ncbi:MAG: hypothetical protein ABL928_07300 [Sphingorhabdus sp.]